MRSNKPFPSSSCLKLFTLVSVLALVSLFITTLLLTGCSSNNTPGNSTPSTAPPVISDNNPTLSNPEGFKPSPSTAKSPATSAETGYQIKVFSKGQQVASLGLTQLHSLPEVTIEMGGDSPGSGPTLQSVLELAGIQEYSKVTISGMVRGRIATAELTLHRAEITDEVLLDFTNQGKTKLCGKQIPQSNWIVDVTEIRAE